MKSRTSIHFGFGNQFQTLLTAVCALAFFSKVQGQEALRMSLAGETTQESQRQAAATIGYYNLLTGPVPWRFSSGLAMEYNDNVHNRQNNPEGDFILRPNLDAQARWPVSQNNILNFSLDTGYSAYMQYQDLSRFYINSGNLFFDISIGDLTINLHDQISITENAYENPTTGGNGNYSLLQNTVGATASWNLDKWVLQGDYDHVNYASLTSSLQRPDGTSDNLLLSAGARFRSKIVAGVEAGGSLINYDQSASSVSPDATQWNAGVYCNAPISDYINARLDLGYTAYSPDATASLTNSSSTSGFYFQFLISHQVNQFINYSLAAGRSMDLAFYGQPYEYYFVRLQPNWNLFNKYQLSTPFWWRQGTEIYNKSVNFDQFGAGINLSRSLTKKLSGAISYQFVQETSNQSGFNYSVNIMGLNLSYQF
jgi:hypothetical protein